MGFVCEFEIDHRPEGFKEFFSRIEKHQEWVGEMIQEDAQRCLELDEKIKRLEAKIADIAKDSKIAKLLRSNPGYGLL
jgi:hypothetical protein